MNSILLFVRKST